MKDSITFDVEGTIKSLREGKNLSGQDGILTPLIKQLTEAVMKAELLYATSLENLVNFLRSPVYEKISL